MLTEIPCVRRGERNFGDEIYRAREMGLCFVWAPEVASVRDWVIEESRKVFALPLVRKMAMRTDNGQRGYSEKGREQGTFCRKVGPNKTPVADHKEHWMIAVKDFPEDHPERSSWPNLYHDNIWPEEVPGFQQSVQALYELVTPIGKDVLRALEPRLGKDPGYYDEITKDGPTVARAIHYLPISSADFGKTIWACDHYDINLVTVLPGSTGPGLRVKIHGGPWVQVRMPQGYVAVQFGLMLERDSGGVIKSTLHGVRASEPGVDRYSLAYFFHPECSRFGGIKGSVNPRIAYRRFGDLLSEVLSDTGMNSGY